MNLSDIQNIAIDLAEEYPHLKQADIQYISFVDLYKKILNLRSFQGTAKDLNEKVLESIQSSWIEECD